MASVISETKKASRPDRQPDHPQAGAEATNSVPQQRELFEVAGAASLRESFSVFVVAWLAVIHLGALLAFVPAFFSWSGLALMFLFHWLTGGIGVCLGYHRMLTHDSFKTHRWVRNVLAIFGGLSGEGSNLHWVANHRKHHAYSDQEGDPHSPHDGAWWSHILWTMADATPTQISSHHRRWIPDLMDDSDLQWCDRMFLPSHIALGLCFAALGFALGGWALAASYVVWGMFVRLTFVLHSTWFVNSASHMWGYRTYETTDDSRNNWWVALLTYGEGWHNNHHAYPRMARHGHKWWEIDMTFVAISMMEQLGLAWDVVDHQHKKRSDKNAVVGPEVDTDTILLAHRQQRNDSPHRGRSRSTEGATDEIQTSS